MYERKAGGETTTFGVSGKLWKDALIMYDRASRSLWSHVTGECVQGEHEGEVLTVFPSVQTTWAEWKSAHPETKVLLKDGDPEEGSRYRKYFDSPDRMGIFGTANSDDRLAGKDLVLGLRLGGETAAYAVKDLDEQGVVNDEIGGEPVVIAWVKESRSAFVFRRQFNEIVLTFQPHFKDDKMYLKDDRSGAIWNATRGEAMGGPARGKQLRPLPSTQVFWFAWSSFFPRTKLWSPPQNEQ